LIDPASHLHFLALRFFCDDAQCFVSGGVGAEEISDCSPALPTRTMHFFKISIASVSLRSAQAF
jgi:hypothetical protein